MDGIRNWDGEYVPDFGDVLVETSGGEEAMKGSLFFATDMDGTMFVNDIGVLMFLKKLSDPKFWQLNRESFQRLLLPNKYFRLVSDVALGVHRLNGHSKELQPVAIQVMALYHDIGTLYGIIRGESRGLRVDQSQVVNEFARKMVEFDRLIMSLEKYLMDENGGQLLMRSRFFVGKRPEHIAELIGSVMMENEKESVDLAVHSDFDENSRIEVSSAALPPLQIETSVRVVQPVLELCRYVGVTVRQNCIAVVTTNLTETARGAVSGSDYHPYIPSENIYGTSLGKGRDGGFKARLTETPLIGDQKAQLAKIVASRVDRVVRLVSGDSNGDMNMMALSLKNGGVVVGVGKTVEEVRGRFEGFLSLMREDGVFEPQKKFHIITYE